MYALRKWSVRHSRSLEWLYELFQRVLIALQPLWLKIGYARLEKPTALLERGIKGLMFDCRMCGNCVLSSTGMACPMNCPKQMRNGPCGGVRANGNCEVDADMRCVWVEAYNGSRDMRGMDKIMTLQVPVDWSAQGSSAWSRQTQREAEQA